MKKILVVEDNEAMSLLLKIRLESEGFSVDIIKSGFALLSYLKDAEEPAAVILDLFIPERSGLELLDSVSNKWKESKIFIYSAQDKLKSMSLRYPAVCGFFSKTGDVKELVDAIKKKI